MPRRVGHHVADDLDACPATPSDASCAAERSSGQSRSAASRSTSIRFRSSGIDRSKLRSPASTCATRHVARGARAGERRVRVAVDEHPVGPLALDDVARSPASSRRRRPCAGRAGTRARGMPSSSKKTCDISGSQCCPVCRTTSSIPAVAQRERERRRLDELRPVPDHGEDAHRALRYAPLARAVSSAGRAGDS